MLASLLWSPLRLFFCQGKGTVMLHYNALLDSEELGSFFATVPWCLGGSLQQAPMLRRALQLEYERFSEWKNPLHISIVTPMWNTNLRYLQELIYSCVLQSWPYWELVLVDNGSTSCDHLGEAKKWEKNDKRLRVITSPSNLGISGGRNLGIKNSRGSVICFLDHDDILHPQALGILARAFHAEQRVNFIYTNEVKLSEDSTSITDYFHKPGFALADLRRTNYLCHLVAIRRDFLTKLGDKGPYFRAEFDGCEDHDLYLRLATSADFCAKHIPVFAYFWRLSASSTAEDIAAKPYVYERAERMLTEHLEQSGLLPYTTIATKPKPPRQLYSLRFRPQHRELVTVIIAYRDQWHLTESCLTQLSRQDLAASLRIVLVDNASQEQCTGQKINALIAKLQPCFDTIKAVHYGGAFNYGKIHNQILKEHVDSSAVLLLNNDVELSTTTTVANMLGELQAHPQTGFVGIRLLYPKHHSVQHAGIKITIDTLNLGLFRAIHVLDADSEFPFDERSAPAVTFACALTRKETIQRLGGFDDLYFPNGQSDVELCLRALRAGYPSFYLGGTTAIHAESATRACADESFEQLQLSLKQASPLVYARIRPYTHMNTKHLVSNSADFRFFLPLRYRLADRINIFLKRSFAPFHRLLKLVLR